MPPPGGQVARTHTHKLPARGRLRRRRGFVAAPRTPPPVRHAAIPTPAAPPLRATACSEGALRCRRCRRAPLQGRPHSRLLRHLRAPMYPISSARSVLRTRSLHARRRTCEGERRTRGARGGRRRAERGARRQRRRRHVSARRTRRVRRGDASGVYAVRQRQPRHRERSADACTVARERWSATPEGSAPRRVGAFETMRR